MYLLILRFCRVLSFFVMTNLTFFVVCRDKKIYYDKIRPISSIFLLFFRLNYFLGHGKSWPFHGTNLMLHGCATFLLGCICKQVFQLQKLTCLITASLFAVHPIHTEAVRSFRHGVK